MSRRRDHRGKILPREPMKKRTIDSADFKQSQRKLPLVITRSLAGRTCYVFDSQGMVMLGIARANGEEPVAHLAMHPADALGLADSIREAAKDAREKGGER